MMARRFSMSLMLAAQMPPSHIRQTAWQKPAWYRRVWIAYDWLCSASSKEQDGQLPTE